MSDLYKGYRGAALKMLQEKSVRVWGEAEVLSTRGKFRGIVLPRSESDDDKHIVLKLASG
ncbi:MAG: Glu-tRNA(Gln) amidotransferase GatDE subunit D, partial [Candidatus Zixiibacteriota bacterium]